MASLRKQACTNMSHVAETFGNSCSQGLIPEKYGRASQVLEVLEWLHGKDNSMELFGLESSILAHPHFNELSGWNSHFSDGILSKIVNLSTEFFVSNTNQLCKRSIILASNLWLICSMNLNSLTVLLYKLYDPEESDCMDYTTLHTLLCDISKFQLENLDITKSIKRQSSYVKVQELLNEIYEYSIARQSAVASLSPNIAAATGVSLESFVTFFNLRKKNQLWSISAFQRKICEVTFGVKVWSEIRVWAHPKYLDLDITSVADWTILRDHVLEEVDEYVVLQNLSFDNSTNFLTTTLPIFGNMVVVGDINNNTEIEDTHIAITMKEMWEEDVLEEENMLSLIEMVTPISHSYDKAVHNKNHFRYDENDVFGDWGAMPSPPSHHLCDTDDVGDKEEASSDTMTELNISYDTTCTTGSYSSSEESHSSVPESSGGGSNSCNPKRKVLWSLLIRPFHRRSKKIIDLTVYNNASSTSTTSHQPSSMTNKKQKLTYYSKHRGRYSSSSDTEMSESITVTYSTSKTHRSLPSRKIFQMSNIRDKICRIFGFE